MDTAVKPVQTGRGDGDTCLHILSPPNSVGCDPKLKSLMTHI